MFRGQVVFLVAILGLVLPALISSQPVADGTPEALIAVGSSITTQNENAQKDEPRPPELRSMHVTSDIRNRYSHTTVSSRYVNPDSKAQETAFSVNLPDTAFITGFLMEIDGKKYEAYVREKEQAKREYDQAVQSGLSAAHVAVNARDSSKFTVSVNVEPQSKITFNLTYEQLLVRKHGKYEVIINLNPEQFINDLQVDVNINETRSILNVDVPALRSGNEILDSDKSKNRYASIIKPEKNVAHITFAPTKEQQKEMMKDLKSEKRFSAQFVVYYDVESDPKGGEVIINDGYFVHFFAPSDLKPIPKHVVFVLDVSSSMMGRKIEQLKDAMKIILSELNPDDYFNLVKFHTTTEVWTGHFNWFDVSKESKLPPAFPANEEFIHKAQKTIEMMWQQGMTGIYDALRVALRFTNKGVQNEYNEGKHQPIIVFLTDGQANVGLSTTKPLVDVVVRENRKKAAVFTLGFGEDANEELLQNLGLQNSGFSRHIYEAADASLQLQDFYKQISLPLLTDVNFKYTDDKVKAVTKHNYDIFFKGSELVVAGKIDEVSPSQFLIECGTVDGPVIYHPTIFPELSEKGYGNLERLWAYLTIKQLLDKKYEKNERNDVETAKQEALKLALKYSFVTPVTSLVVVKPNKTELSAHVKRVIENDEFIPSDWMKSGISFTDLNSASIWSPNTIFVFLILINSIVSVMVELVY